MIPYEDLEKHFTKPKNWTPGKQAFFDKDTLPRKLKKLGKRWHEDPCAGLWYRLSCVNPDYHRFLIKLVCQSQNI